jgi:hypothetical protein
LIILPRVDLAADWIILPRVDLAADWIILTLTGCNLNRTVDTARCETDSEQYKTKSDCLETCSELGALQVRGYEGINTA